MGADAVPTGNQAICRNDVNCERNLLNQKQFTRCLIFAQKSIVLKHLQGNRRRKKTELVRLIEKVIVSTAAEPGTSTQLVLSPCG